MVGTAPAFAPASSAQPAWQASSTLSASRVPSLLMTTAPAHQRCAIQVLRPFGRTRSPNPGARLSHRTASRPPSTMSRPLRFVLVTTVATRPFHGSGNAQDTPGNGAGFGVRKERLLDTLFKTKGRDHVNIKFCRGTASDISPDDLCAEANSAIAQIDAGLAETRETFGDKGVPTKSVAEMLKRQRTAQAAHPRDRLGAWGARHAPNRNETPSTFWTRLD